MVNSLQCICLIVLENQIKNRPKIYRQDFQWLHVILSQKLQSQMSQHDR